MGRGWRSSSPSASPSPPPFSTGAGTRGSQAPQLADRWISPPVRPPPHFLMEESQGGWERGSHPGTPSPSGLQHLTHTQGAGP